MRKYLSALALLLATALAVAGNNSGWTNSGGSLTTQAKTLSVNAVSGGSSGGNAALGWNAPSGIVYGATLNITTDGTNNFGSGHATDFFDDFLTGTAGNAVTSSNTSFNSSVPDAAHWPHLSTDARSPGFAVTVMGYHPGDFGAPNVYTVEQGVYNFSSPVTEAFVSYAVKVPSGKYAPGATAVTTLSNNSVWKTGWLERALDSGDSGTNDFITTNFSGGSGNTLEGNGIQNRMTINDLGGGNQDALTWFDFAGWTNISTWVRADPTNPSTVAGNLAVILSSDNKTLYTQSSTPIIFVGGGVASPYQWRSYTVPGWVTSTDQVNQQVLYDDIYVSVGANSAARVELTDASTYAGSHKRALCKITSWSSTAIAVKITSGNINLAGTVWAHITKSDNSTRLSVQINTVLPFVLVGARRRRKPQLPMKLAA